MSIKVAVNRQANILPTCEKSFLVRQSFPKFHVKFFHQEKQNLENSVHWCPTYSPNTHRRSRLCCRFSMLSTPWHRDAGNFTLQHYKISIYVYELRPLSGKLCFDISKAKSATRRPQHLGSSQTKPWNLRTFHSKATFIRTRPLLRSSSEEKSFCLPLYQLSAILKQDLALFLVWCLLIRKLQLPSLLVL